MIHLSILPLRLKKLLLPVLLCCSLAGAAQPDPPRPIIVTANPAQGLIFGAFFQGASGGTVIVQADGSRSSTGSIVLANLGYVFSPAVYEIDANVGTLISIMNGPDVTLSGSNGGTISLHIGAASTGASFTTTAVSPATTAVRIGGTLTIGTALANPSGAYSGSYMVTFIQQ